MDGLWVEDRGVEERSIRVEEQEEKEGVARVNREVSRGIKGDLWRKKKRKM